MEVFDINTTEVHDGGRIRFKKRGKQTKRKGK